MTSFSHLNLSLNYFSLWLSKQAVSICRVFIGTMIHWWIIIASSKVFPPALKWNSFFRFLRHLIDCNVKVWRTLRILFLWIATLLSCKDFLFIDYYVSIWHTMRILLWCFYYVSISCIVRILLLRIVSILPIVGFIFWSNDTLLSYALFNW